MHIHLVRDHESRIETHPKLADQWRARRVLTRALQRLYEGLRPGVRDGAEILDQLCTREADAMVRDGQGACLFIRSEMDLQRQMRLSDFIPRKLGVLQLFHGVRSVADQFTDKDFLVGVKRVNDDIEKLADFCLELAVLGGLAHRGSVFWGKSKMGTRSVMQSAPGQGIFLPDEVP
jgi:hypothetical protein